MKKNIFKTPALALASLLIGAGGALATGAVFAFTPDETGTTAQWTEEQREALDEIQALKEQAKVIAEEADVPCQRFCGECGMGNGRHGKMMGPDAQDAIANNDYAAFMEAVADAPLKSEISEEDFAKLVEADALRKSGDMEGAHAIMVELGAPFFGNRMGPGRGEGMPHGFGGRQAVETEINTDAATE